MPDPVNITIRRAEPSDYPAYQQIILRRAAGHPGHCNCPFQLPSAGARCWRSRHRRHFRPGGCVNGEVICQLFLGTFRTKRRRHAGQIGMSVRDDWQGRGVGAALMQVVVDLADRWLNLNLVQLEVYTDNEPAVRLYKKFGFAIEGTMIRYGYRDGQFVDVYAMARRARYFSRLTRRKKDMSMLMDFGSLSGSLSGRWQTCYAATTSRRITAR